MLIFILLNDHHIDNINLFASFKNLKSKQNNRNKKNVRALARARVIKREREREEMDRPALSSPPKDGATTAVAAGVKEELSTSTTTQTTATRGVGEKFRTLSIDFNEKNQRGDDVFTAMTTRGGKKNGGFGRGGREMRMAASRGEFDGLIPKGFRAVHGERFAFSDAKEETKDTKILMFPGSRLCSRRTKATRAHNAEHDEIVVIEKGTNNRDINGNRNDNSNNAATVIWMSSSAAHVQTVRAKLALPSEVLDVQFCRFGLSRKSGKAGGAASLCAMHEDGVLVYNPLSGEVLDVPRPEGCREMWPCAFGLVFRREDDGKLFLVEHPTDAPHELKRIGGDGDDTTEADISDVEIVWSDLDDELIVCRNVTSNTFCVFRAETVADPSSIDIEADLATNLIYREKCVALFEAWTEPTNTQDNVEFIKARGREVEFAESTGACGLRRLHFCFPEIKMRTSIDLLPMMMDKTKKRNNRHEKSAQNWVVSRTPCASVASVQSTRAPYLDILVVGEDECVELYRNADSEDVQVCRLAILHSSEEKRGQGLDDGENVDRPYESAIRCTGKVWGSIGNRVNVDVAEDTRRRTLRCILPGPPSDPAVRNAVDAMLENDDKNVLLRRFYEKYPSGSLQSDAEWASFCAVAKEVCGFLLGVDEEKDDAMATTSRDEKENKINNEMVSLEDGDANWQFTVESDMHSKYANSFAFLRKLRDRKSVDASENRGDSTKSKQMNRMEHIRQTTEVTSGQSISSPLLSDPNAFLEALHVAYECAKLDTTQRLTLSKLGGLIRELASGLGNDNLLAYHSLECGNPMLLPVDQNTGEHEIFDMIKACGMALKGTLTEEYLPKVLGRVVCDDMYRNDLSSASICNWANDVLRCCYELSPARDFAALGDKFDASSPESEEKFASRHLEASNRFAYLAAQRNFTLARIARLPSGLQLCFRSALRLSRENPPKNWPSSAYVLIGRDDMAELSMRDAAANRKMYAIANRKIESSRDGIDDDDDDDSFGTQNASARASASSSSATGLKADDDALDAYDGMDHIEAFVGPLRFPKDRRIVELRNLLATARPAPIYLGNPNTSNVDDMDDDQEGQNASNVNEDDPNAASDPDAVTQQQAKLWARATRTSAAPVGRGAATLRTLRPKPTEPLKVPKLCFSGTLPAQRNAILRLDLNANPKAKADFMDWPDFHNGVASGLALKGANEVNDLNGDSEFSTSSDNNGDGEVTRSWIVFNRPKQASHSHAGALMALGLNGHLSRMTATDLYRYLAQEHEATTVAALIGVAAANRGTADPATARLCFLHLPARHPLSFPELELPALVQAAALLSVGILHEGTADRMMVEILLAEIGAQPSGERGDFGREGYTLAAGFALGLTTLGLGDNAIGLADLKIKERLRRYAIGGSAHAKGFSGNYGGANGPSLRKTSIYYGDGTSGGSKRIDDSYVNYDPVIATFEENEYQAEDDIMMNGKNGGVGAGGSSSMNNGYVLEGNVVNVDLSAPGAMLALGLMYLKTNDEDATEHLCVPSTRYELDHTQPDFVLLRVVARSLILWDSVRPTRRWVESNCPVLLKRSAEDLDRGYIKTSETVKKSSNTLNGDVREGDDDDDDEQPRSFREGPDREAEAQARVHAIAGACLSLGLRYAGTADETAANTLRHYCLQFLEWKKAALNAGERKAVVDRPTLEKCVGCCAMAAAAVMAGTGDVPTLRLLRHLRARLEAPESNQAQSPNKDKDKNKSGMSYGAHMAIQTAIGFLFLGGAARTFSTENDAVAYLLIAMYPRFPTDTNDHRCHCQAFRHLYVLASRERLLTTVDIESKSQTSAPVEIDVLVDANRRKYKTIKTTTPCLAPDTKTIREIRVTSKNLWPTSRTFGGGDAKNRIVNLEIPVMQRLRGDIAVQSNDASDDVNAASLRPPIIDSFLSVTGGVKSSASLDVELIRNEGGGPNLNPRTHSELFGFDALSNASVLLPPDFKRSRIDKSWIDRVNFSKAAQRECTRREIPDALPCYVDLYSALEHLAASCSDAFDDECTISEADVRKFTAFTADVKILETFLESRCFTSESNFGDTTKATSFAKLISRVRNTSNIEDDSNDALATMAIPAKLINAIRRSTELLIEERTRAYIAKAIAASEDDESQQSRGGELMCAYSRLLELPSLAVLKAATRLAIDTFGDVSAATLSYALAETTNNAANVPSSLLVKFASLFSNSS